MSSASSKKRRMIKSPYHDLLDPGVLQGLDSEAIITSNSHVVSTEDVKILGKALRNGSFCTAFRCILLINGDEMECVVKIPNFVGRKVVDGKLPTISQPHVRALVDFEHELLITRHLLEPDSYTAWYDKGSDQASMVPYSKLENFHKDLLTLQEHPGYKHIHKMIHMEPASLNRSYPMLFSEQCEKTLLSLSGEHYFTSTMSLPWLDGCESVLGPTGAQPRASLGAPARNRDFQVGPTRNSRRADSDGGGARHLGGAGEAREAPREAQKPARGPRHRRRRLVGEAGPQVSAR